MTSERKENPFIAVNCGALTESLLTSQLFGHKKGAFTGALSDQEGLFEAANGGTIFLDEIGDVPMNIQTNLLRVLQEKEITRIGENKPRKIDVRVIAASQHDLIKEVENGNFRADLLYRIRVTRINLPDLKDRKEDIPLLVNSFLSQSRASSGKNVYDISGVAMSKLMNYDWPGNIRELKSAIDFAALTCKGTVINKEDLPPEITHDETQPAGINDDIKQDEKQKILAALEQTSGNKKEASKLLGISRATFYRRLIKYELI
jgi:transcriptional regulator with PAS, ATPase and Fis domain